MHDLTLLSIVIPTWNRSEMLALLLEVLMPQIQGNPEIEVIVCDNASTDETEAVVSTYLGDGVRYHKHPENLGSDANFVYSFDVAQGRYFWLCSDDDLPVPGTIQNLLLLLHRDEFDLVYLTSYGYREDWLLERRGDPLGRRHHTIVDGPRFASIVNIMFTFISGMIINKQRLASLMQADSHIEAPSAFIGTHFTQMSWTLPLLKHHRKSLVLWNRPVACRLGHGGGYNLAQTFGTNLHDVLARCLGTRDDLSRAIVNPALRKWFPSILVQVRSTPNSKFDMTETHETLKRVFGRNYRYWLFTYPCLVMPVCLAKCWSTVGSLISRLAQMSSYPRFWRKVA